VVWLFQHIETRRISQDSAAFVLSVAGDVLVDNETFVVTFSILRICRSSKILPEVGFVRVYS
jgi:hypothetical protein